MEPPPSIPAHSVATLAAMFQTAVGLADSLARNPEPLRLLGLLRGLPAGEREALVALLEREARARRRSLALGDGAVGPPDPRARVFFRVIDCKPVPAVTRDELVQQTVRAGRLLARLPDPLRATLLGHLHAAAAAVAPEQRAAMMRHHEDVLALFDRCDRIARSGEPA